MTNRLHPVDNKEIKPSISKRAAATALIAGAALAATGCESDAPKSAEKLTPSEIAAQSEAHDVYENLRATDIVKCQVASISEGPAANYQGEKRPTLKVSLSVEPGDRYNDKWLIDGGSQVGNYNAEIVWMNPGILVSHEISAQGDSPYLGVAVPEEAFAPKSQLQPQNPDLPFFEHSIDNSSEQLVSYIIPINDKESFQGKRKMHVEAVVGSVKLLENSPGSPMAGEKRLSETCAFVDLDVSADKIKVLSAHDAGGKEIDLKTD